jgi:hypothetical protein
MNLKYVGVFFISLMVGSVMVYLLPLEYKTVIVNPTPDNLTKIQYVDKSENCFEFSSTKVGCTPNAKQIDVQ